MQLRLSTLHSEVNARQWLSDDQPKYEVYFHAA